MLNEVEFEKDKLLAKLGDTLVVDKLKREIAMLGE
jgi:hypothetical protein